MPWTPGDNAGDMIQSWFYYTVQSRNLRAELYNDSTLVKSLRAVLYAYGATTNGGYLTITYSDSSTDVYTFNKIVLKRDPYTAPDGSSKDVILTINIPGDKIKTANRTLTFSIKLTIATTSG